MKRLKRLPLLVAGLALTLTVWGSISTAQTRKPPAKRKAAARTSKKPPPHESPADSLFTFEFDDWERIASSSVEDYFGNRKTVVRLPDGAIKIWIKTVPREGKLADVITDWHNRGLTSVTSAYSHEMILWQFNCRERLERVTTRLVYERKGEPPASLTNKDAEWREIAPDTVAESLLNFTCRPPR